MDWTPSYAAAQIRAARFNEAFVARKRDIELRRSAARGEIIDAEFVDVTPAPLIGPGESTRGEN